MLHVGSARPIFIRSFVRLGVEPGTVIALMLPCFVGLSEVWTLFFMAWHLLGLPWGLGA